MRPDPVFLLGAHKSGTSLLRALFDGIEEYAVLPIETHPFQILDYGIRYPYRKQNAKELSFERAYENALKWVKKSNINNDKYSDSLTINMFEETVFENQLNKNKSNLDSKLFIENYFAAVYDSYRKNQFLKDNQRFVEKSVENVEFALDLMKLFPDSKFIHIIRNPYSNLVSLRKYKSTHGYPNLDKPVKALFESYYNLFRNERLIENYKIIKYEDLISKPNLVINDICESLNITFHSEMLEPTVNNGQNWQGNSTTDTKFSGISDKRLNDWEKQIYPIEIDFVNKLFPHILERFNYKKLTPGKIFLKNPKESIKTYAFNRILLNRATKLV